ncbi:MAG: Tyrosine recombinase XerD [bacterium ADurb.Bin157]|jgi:integrase|nr:MAG: Tyrosine recombinase XerD [bacterium ADurb.Bin157]
MKRHKTEYKGVYYRLGDRLSAKGKEKIFYIVFKKNGKVYEEKVGRQHADDMTAAKASRKRSARIDGKIQSRKEIREQAKAAKIAEAGKMTLSRLWDEYKESKGDTKSINTDKGRFEKYLKPDFGNKEPHKIIRLDVDRLRVNLLKEKKPQTVKHVLGLLKRIVHFGVARQLCQSLNFEIEAVKVDNQKTEDLNPEQLKNLLKAIDNSTDIEAANIMRLALYTGMRRGEMFKLTWNDIDFQRGFISIRNPKGGVSQKIPLNEQARHVLESHPKRQKNKDKNNPEYYDHIFLRPDNKPFTDIRRRINPIKEVAELPADFRPLHGLRHTYASMLASSGKVDLYTLQKLLTHKSPVMTQRYAHLRDEALKNASALAGQIIEQATNTNVVELHEGSK